MPFCRQKGKNLAKEIEIKKNKAFKERTGTLTRNVGGD